MSEVSQRFDGALFDAYAGIGGIVGNRATGLGVKGRDKFLETSICYTLPLSRQELQALYRNSVICQKVVDLLPKSATSENWLELTIGAGRKNVPAKALQYAENLKLRQRTKEAGIMGRWEGDGFIVIGVDDGLPPYEPVNEKNIRQISWLASLSRYQLYPDHNSGRPGEPEFYRFTLPQNEALANPDGGTMTIGRIHRSRVLRFPGKRLYGELINYNEGYNDSVLQAFYTTFAKYLVATEYSARMVADYNVFTYKLKGLANLVLQGKSEDILKRFTAILMGMSSMGGLAMDSENEDASFITRNFSGLDALIDRLKDDASAAANMPPTKLWGSSQKTALSNSSEGDKYEWADCVANYQADFLEEPITDFFRLILLAKNGPTGGRLPDVWDLKYKSTLRLNLAEQVALRGDQTTKVDIPLLSKGILLPEEVRAAWDGTEYTIERTLQPDLWEQKQAEQEEQAQQAEEEPEEELAPDNTEEEAAPASEQDFLSNSLTDQKRDSEEDEYRDPFNLTGGTSRTDGTPCGRGWTGTKPGCKRSKKGAGGNSEGGSGGGGGSAGGGGAATPAPKAKSKKKSKSTEQEGEVPATAATKSKKKKVETQLSEEANAKAEGVVSRAKKNGTAKKKGKAQSTEEGEGDAIKSKTASGGSDAPTLKPKKYNKDAIEDLDVDEFKRFRQDRDFLKVQDDPNVPINQSFDDWKKGQEFQSLATKAKYKGELTDAIAAGYAPSDKILSSAGVKLTKKQQTQLEKNRKDIEVKRQQNARVQKAIDHPLMTDEEAKGYKPVLSKEEADRYTRDSFVGNSSFYHGNRRDIIDSMRTDGIQPDKNNAGIFGKGAYFATSKEVAESYANAASTNGEGRVGLIEAKAKVKNPYVMSAEQLSNIGSHFPGDQSTLIDSTAVQEFIKAKGHDSIYIPDKGYFVTFDQRQAVTVNSEDFTRGDARQSAIAKFWEKRLTGDDENAISRTSDTFKALSQVKPSETRQYQYADDTEEDDFNF